MLSLVFLVSSPTAITSKPDLDYFALICNFRTLFGSPANRLSGGFQGVK